jgi:hypothetical protein
MQIEQQVPSLQICKRLKDLGFPPNDTEFVWMHERETGTGAAVYTVCRRPPEYSDPGEMDLATEFGWMNDTQYSNMLEDWYSQIAAPTVAELGEALPPYVTTQRDPVGWWRPIEIKGNDVYPCTVIAERTEAEARARFWILLRENMEPTIDPEER